MKKNTVLMLLVIVIIGSTGALDIESYQFADRLLQLKEPGAPEIIGDGVLFTAPSSYRRVGAAFAHEGFSRVYWFRNLRVMRNDISAEEYAQGSEDLYRDSGILFHAYTPPEGMRELEYRLIIDGLWTTDPLNPLRRLDAASGVYRSVVEFPAPRNREPVIPPPPEGSAVFRFQGPPGERVTVAGSFNRWDPFMYEMRELRPGIYYLSLPLPPGTHYYVFYHQGKRLLDPGNSRKGYNPEGSPVSEITDN